MLGSVSREGGLVCWAPARDHTLSSRPVAIAKRIVARTAFMSGFQSSPSDVVLPPKWKEMLSLCVPGRMSVSARCVAHRVHRRRKCSTVSLACPHAHWAEGTALIRNSEAFSLAMPVLSWASMLASIQERLSYSSRVCLPGSAMSTSFESFPTLSGSRLSTRSLRLAALRVVDRIFGNCFSGEAPSRLAGSICCSRRCCSCSSLTTASSCWSGGSS